jgi:hypothetical protein
MVVPEPPLMLLLTPSLVVTAFDSLAAPVDRGRTLSLSKPAIN